MWQGRQAVAVVVCLTSPSPRVQGHRLCLAVPGEGNAPKGMLLGSSPGGGILYVEPPAAAPLNNELAAARGESYAAEEAILWRVTGVVMQHVDSLQHALDTVSLQLHSARNVVDV